MRRPNDVLAAKCSDRWIGLRSPVSSANPTTSFDETVFSSVSVMPTERSSKKRICRGRTIDRAIAPGLGHQSSDVTSRFCPTCRTLSHVLRLSGGPSRRGALSCAPLRLNGLTQYQFARLQAAD